MYSVSPFSEMYLWYKQKGSEALISGCSRELFFVLLPQREQKGSSAAARRLILSGLQSFVHNFLNTKIGPTIFCLLFWDHKKALPCITAFTAALTFVNTFWLQMCWGEPVFTLCWVRQCLCACTLITLVGGVGGSYRYTPSRTVQPCSAAPLVLF